MLWLPWSVTRASSLTDFCLVDLIDVTLAREAANSKLVEVVSIADVDAEKLVDDQGWTGKLFSSRGGRGGARPKSLFRF